MKNFFKSNGAIICLIVLLFLVMGVVFILLHLFSTRDFSYEICCALIGTIITAVVTVFLLQGQSSSDEKKDKNIRIYENNWRCILSMSAKCGRRLAMTKT